jgi:hypothetical protein
VKPSQFSEKRELRLSQGCFGMMPMALLFSNGSCNRRASETYKNVVGFPQSPAKSCFSVCSLRGLGRRAELNCSKKIPAKHNVNASFQAPEIAVSYVPEANGSGTSPRLGSHVVHLLPALLAGRFQVAKQSCGTISEFKHGRMPLLLRKADGNYHSLSCERWIEVRPHLTCGRTGVRWLSIIVT